MRCMFIPMLDLLVVVCSVKLNMLAINCITQKLHLLKTAIPFVVNLREATQKMAQINKYKHSPFYGICLEDLHLNKRAQDMLDIQKTIMPYSIFSTLLENSKY